MRLDLWGAMGRQRRQAAEVRALVQGFFGDAKKTEVWMNSTNPLLGGLRPVEMIRLGRGEKLLKTVRNLLDENRRAA